MASPVGHVIVGVAVASAAAAVTGAPQGPSLWLGAGAASVLPDLDLALRVIGLRGPRFHRNATHSLLSIGALALFITALHTHTSLAVDWRFAVPWAAALLTHPLLDLLTTGPETSREGYGIPLLWPVHRRRWFVSRPICPSLDLSRCRSWRDLWQGVRTEIVSLTPFALLAVGLALVL